MPSSPKARTQWSGSALSVIKRVKDKAGSRNMQYKTTKPAAPRVAPNGATVTTAVPVVTVHAPVVISVGLRRTLWSLLVTLQIINAVLLALLAFLYATRSSPGSLLWTAALHFLFADEADFIDSYCIVLATGYSLLGAAFAVNSLRLVWLSVRRRRVQFGGAGDKLASRAVLMQSKPNLASAVFSPMRFNEWTSTSRWKRVVEWIESVTFITGVHGPFFDVRYIAGRLIGIISQTAAAYSSSESVSNLPLNQTYGAVLFLSCVSSPVLHRVLRSRPSHQRLAFLVADLILDFLWGSIVPAWMHFNIVYSHYAALNDTATSAREAGRVLVLTWPRYALSLVPFVSSFVSCIGIQEVLCVWSAPPSSPRPGVSISMKGVDKQSQGAGESQRKKATRFLRKWSKSVIHGTIAVYGCAVLVVSLAASDILGLIVKQPLYPCVYQLHPWFSTKEACVKRFINCTALGIEGRRADIEAALVLFDGPSLSDLHLQNCPALELPTTLHQFDTLTRLVIQYSWISEWSVQAGLTSETSTTLKTIKLIHTDTNVTLHGLVSVPIAKTIEYIRFNFVPNAETILRPIGTNWQHLHYFECDNCNLPDVPLAIDTMYRLLALSFINSRIAHLRDNWIQSDLDALWMDGNEALTELSDKTWRQSATCAMFSMQSTNLSTIPDMVLTTSRRDFVVYGFGSPLCDPSAIALRQADSARARRLVICTENDG